MNESSTDITAREGTNVSLLCKAKGYPSPNISWRREDNQPIPLGTWHGKKVLDNGTLQTQHIHSIRDWIALNLEK
ncbi:lachesin [Trichonephila clavipes]|nr:lachesin [Trichonephila clavipes]